jgi:hypothetical protein
MQVGPQASFSGKFRVADMIFGLSYAVKNQCWNTVASVDLLFAADLGSDASNSLISDNISSAVVLKAIILQVLKQSLWLSNILNIIVVMPKPPTAQCHPTTKKMPPAPGSPTEKPAGKDGHENSKPCQGRQSATTTPKKRVDRYLSNNRKEPIDLTGDDSSTPSPITSSATTKSVRTASSNLQTLPRTLQRPVKQPAASLHATTTLRTQNDKSGNTVAGKARQHSPSLNHPNKRARCDDGPETDTGSTTAGIVHYHMPPPDHPNLGLRNTGALTDLGKQPGSVIDGSLGQQSLLARNALPADLNASIARPVLAPHLSLPLQNTQHTALVQDNNTQPDTPALQSRDTTMKAETDLAQQGTPSKPSMKQKVAMAEELSKALYVSPKTAFQVLRYHGWDEDSALLAYFANEEKKAEAAKADGGQ